MKTLVTKTNLLSVAVTSLMLAASVACAPESPRLMAPPEKYGVAAEEAKPEITNVTPMVDILLVIDNSGSMADEQEKLSKNIDQFATALSKNSNVDFHIGTVSVWDSITFAGMDKEYKHGELRRLKDPKGENLPESFGRFVSSKENYDTYLSEKGFNLSKEPGWVQVLKASMKIGIEKYDSKFAESRKSGPNIEEIFSPVKMALSEPMASGANVNFRRAGAHLVLFFITDSDSTSIDLSGSDLREFLAGLVGNGAQDKKFKEQVSAIGVLAKASDPVSERDPQVSGKVVNKATGEKLNDHPAVIESFITSVGGVKMGLRDKDFGAQMAKHGAWVRERALKNPIISLSRRPEWGTLKVSMNGQDLVLGESWLYDPEFNSVHITSDLSKYSGALDIKVDFTPISESALRSGRVYSPAK